MVICVDVYEDIFTVGGVAAYFLHEPYGMQGGLVAAGLMGAVAAGLVPVVKVKKSAA